MNTFKNQITTALITPFLTNGKIDYKGLSLLIERQIEAGVESLLILGSTGEASTINIEERKEMIKFIRKYSNVKIITGITTNSTVESIELGKISQDLGADFLLCAPPFYNKPTQDGLFKHFSEIAKNLTAPLILYNIPGRTGNLINNDTIIKLSQEKNIIAIKDSSADFPATTELIDKVNQNFSIISGDDEMFLAHSVVGVRGLMSVVSNLAPKLSIELCKLINEGNFLEAKKINAIHSEISRAIFSVANPIGMKYAISKVLIIENILRSPLFDIERNDQIDDILQKFKQYF